MLAFDVLYPEVARNEARAITTLDAAGAPAATLVFREMYCNEPRCDCRRVILLVHHVERQRLAATINYAFEPPEPPHDKYEHQVFLDPLNPQSELADAVLDLFIKMIANDGAYHDRLVRHYEMWKRVVDDPGHPLHAKVRSAEHDNPSFRPAFRWRKEQVRGEPPCGAYEPCPCGSGQKYKFCCRDRVAKRA